ncbi:MAG TPA: amino acid deaminase [Acidobacteriaceae bacterium]|nr:amino acid deaminase [Acidobacteriaceae bacterium]
MVELNKGVGFGETAARSWNILREDVSLPCAVLYEDRLRHNLEWMRRFIAAYGVKLAPHGKTTMAPKLFAMQLAGGAWGITLATAHQTAVAHTQGIRRVLMANQLVGRENMAMVSRLLEDPRFEFYCLIDSAPGVDQLGAFFREREQRLRVLLELGVAGGRTGVRDDEQMQTVMAALDRQQDILELCGVEMYEGVLDDAASIRAFLRRAVFVTRQLLAEKRFRRTPALLSGAGSAWYDVVAEEFSTAQLGDAVEIILRPGCYLTHDVGAYRAAQTRISANNPVAQRMHSELLPALQVWAYVQSRPEPKRAIIAMGKRDAAFDSGLPTPALYFRPSRPAPGAAPSHWTITKMMDQHAYMQIAAEDDLRVGDMIGFDISHPCLTFDKWRTLLVVDASYDVIDLVETFF